MMHKSVCSKRESFGNILLGCYDAHRLSTLTGLLQHVAVQPMKNGERECTITLTLTKGLISDRTVMIGMTTS